MTRRRTMLVPNSYGSVEHFYHFLLGYLVPAAQWIERTGATEVTVRDCGPMTPWFDLLRPRADVEVVPPGLMLKLVVGRHRPMAVMPPLDNPMLFDSHALRGLAGGLRAAAGVASAGDPSGILVTDRGPAAAYYASDASENRTAGTDRRSIPNMAEIADALGAIGPVTFADAAALSPREQIEAFAGARVLVGQHGAGLANMIWMAPGTTVVEILPPMGPSVWTLFSDLADAMGLRYARVLQESMHSPVAAADVVAAIGSAPPPRTFGAGEEARRRALRVGKSAEIRLLRSASLRWAVRLVR